MKCHCVPTLLLAATIAALASTELPAQSAAPAEASPSVGVRRALVVCGLTGDTMRREAFAATVEKIYTGLAENHGFATDNITVLWSDEPTDMDGPALKASHGQPTRETIEETVGALAQSLQPADALWVFVLGHGHYDGRYSWLNIPGNDLHQLEFARLFSGVRCHEQVFFLTQSASGFFIKPLALPGRIVITATEPDLEVNETHFPHKLAMALAESRPFSEMDLDRDGRLSLLDAYLWTAREVAVEYATPELLATEHAQLDDSGDGRGTEPQADFLPEELGGRLRAGRDVPQITTGDGALARRMFLSFPPSPPAPDIDAQD